MLSATALEGLPELTAGDDLAALIVSALGADGPADSDVLVIAHKVVSKAEGRVRRLSDVEPSDRARELAERLGKNPRHVQVILDETQELVRAERGVLICRTHQGFVCANAGIDASNIPGEDTVVLLPEDPDASARHLRAQIEALTGARPGIVITDSFGRAWRIGQVDLALGCAGIRALDDWRGRPDAQGRELKATMIAVADELAAAADLARAKDLSQPVVMVRGAGGHVTAEDGPGARTLIRPYEENLFR